MKAYVKVLLIVAAALSLVGVICFTVLAARGGFDSLESISNQDHIKKGSEYELNPTGEIVIDIDTTELIVIPSDNELIGLTYYESEQTKYAIDHQSSCLSISYIKPAFSFKWLFSFDLGDHPMTLSIPRNFAGCIEIKSSTGNVSVKNISDLYELSIITTTGNVELESISANVISTAVKTGRINAKKLNAELDINLSTTTGSIILNDAVASSISTESSTGSHKLSALVSESSRHTATTGSIKFEKIDSKDIFLKATTGSVIGSLVGKREDFEVSAKTSTGNCNIAADTWMRDPAPERRLAAETSTGDIHITFDE